MLENKRLQFKGAPEGWVVNQLHGNYWKVEPLGDWDDIMQEARVCFCEVYNTYPEVEDRHLMALFKTAWSRRFIDLAHKATRHRSEISVETLPLETPGELSNSGFLAVLIEQAPDEVRSVLSLFLNAPSELLELATQSWRAKGRRKAEGNSMINQCLGLPEGSDPIGAVEDYFLR